MPQFWCSFVCCYMNTIQRALSRLLPWRLSCCSRYGMKDPLARDIWFIFSLAIDPLQLVEKTASDQEIDRKEARSWQRASEDKRRANSPKIYICWITFFSKPRWDFLRDTIFLGLIGPWRVGRVILGLHPAAILPTSPANEDVVIYCTTTTTTSRCSRVFWCLRSAITNTDMRSKFIHTHAYNRTPPRLL